MVFGEIVQLAKDICSIVACAALLIKPVREWLLGTKEIREGQRCLLRAEIVRIYYRRNEDRQLKEYEFKNMDHCYDAYKALKGNSFVDKIHSEMKDWEII